jgi:hypothetical protein
MFRKEIALHVLFMIGITIVSIFFIQKMIIS